MTPYRTPPGSIPAPPVRYHHALNAAAAAFVAAISAASNVVLGNSRAWTLGSTAWWFAFVLWRAYAWDRAAARERG